jgi:hypothetical protein
MLTIILLEFAISKAGCPTKVRDRYSRKIKGEAPTPLLIFLKINLIVLQA